MKLVYLITLLLSFNLLAQDIQQERIRKISKRKKSIYIDEGIFHNGSVKNQSALKAVRHSFNSKNGFERIVFDFNSQEVPKIYGYYGGKVKKIFLDFFDTKIMQSADSFGDARFVEKLEFYPITKDRLSLEVTLKNSASLEAFVLENPARLVIDIKK